MMSTDCQPPANNNSNNNNGRRTDQRAGDINIDLTTNNGNTNKNHQYLVLSNAMRSYMESLPDRMTIREELSRYQFWKSLRTEFIATFLFVIFTSGPLAFRHRSNITTTSNENYDDDALSNIGQLKNSLALGLTAATLVQCTGHVSGCHLTIAITIGLHLSGRVSMLRLFAYLLVHCLASVLGMIVAQCLSKNIVALNPGPEISGSQVFGFEFLATTVIVLTYLANCDPHRRDLGYKALSIGLSYSIAHLFASEATGAALSPTRALAVSLLTGNFYLHWIYWVSPVLAGLFGGLLYEYIGSIKPSPRAISCNCHCNMTPSSATAELRHQFNAKVPTNVSTVLSSSSSSSSTSTASSGSGCPNNNGTTTIATISNGGGNKNPLPDAVDSHSSLLFSGRDEETEFSLLATSDNFFERARY